jgi:hypothetical protein
MKLFLKHKLPRRLRYARVYLEAANASLFFSLDGPSASWYASIGGSVKRPVSLSDKDYSIHRASSKVVEVVDEDQERIILRTEAGDEEEWVRPRWILAGLRRARKNGNNDSGARRSSNTAQPGR